MEGAEVEEVYESQSELSSEDGETNNNETTLDDWKFSKKITNHIKSKNDIRKAIPVLQRALRILKETQRRGFGAEDYANEKALESCYLACNQKKFRDFLRLLIQREYQRLFFAFLSFIGWDKGDIRTAMGHITHFNCKRRHGEQHSTLCLQKVELTHWQRRWFPEEANIDDSGADSSEEDEVEVVQDGEDMEDEEKDAAGDKDKNNNNNENEVEDEELEELDELHEEEGEEQEEVPSKDDEEEGESDEQSPELETDDHEEEVRTVSDDSPHFFHDLSLRQTTSPNITLFKIELGQTQSRQWGHNERENFLRLIKSFSNLVKIEIDSNYLNVLASATAFPPPAVSLSASAIEFIFPTVKVLKLNQLPIPIGFLSRLPNLEALEFTPRISGRALGRGWTDPVVSDYNPSIRVLRSMRNHQLTSFPESDIWHLAPFLQSLKVFGNQGDCDEEYTRDGNVIRRKFIKRSE